MKKINHNLLAIKTGVTVFLLFLSLASFAQSLTGPEVLCSGGSGTYYFADDGTYTLVNWYQDGVYKGTSNNKFLTWSSSGVVSVDVFNGSTFLYSLSLSVSVKGPGYITASSSLVCSNTSVTLTRNNSVGNSFTWQARPAGQSWTNFGAGGVSVNYTVITNTEFQVILSDCSSGNISSIYTVSVIPTQTGGTIAPAASNVCYGSSAAAIQNTVNPTGQNSSYQWQSSPNNSVWTNISGATQFIYTPGVLYSPTYFRRMATGCSVTTPSNAILIQVDSPSNAGSLSVSGASSFCDTGTINLALSSVTGTITKWWVRSKDGGGAFNSWTVFSTSSASTNSFSMSKASTTMDRTYEFQASVKNGLCAEVSGNIVSGLASPLSVAGTLSGAAAHCFNNTISLSNFGHVGAITKWSVRSKDGAGAFGAWSVFSTGSGTSNSYAMTPASTTQNRTYEFQVSAKSGACAEVSGNVISSVVSPLSIAGTLSISGASSFCSSGTISLALSGYTSTVTKWSVRSKDGAGAFGAWTIFSTTNASTNSYAMTQATTVIRTYEFQAFVTSGICPEVSSNVVTGSISPLSVAGTLSGPAAYCSNNTISLSNSGHVGTITKWSVRSKDGAGAFGAWSVFSTGSGTSNSYAMTPASTTQNRTYEFQVSATSGTCAEVSGNVISTVVSPLSIAGTLSISGASSFCSSGTISLALSGYTGTVTKWQVRSKDGTGSFGGWTIFSTTNAAANSYGVSSTSTEFRTYEFAASVASGICPELATNTVTAYVYPTSVGGNTTISGAAENYTTSGSATISASSAVGVINLYQQSLDGVVWNTIGTNNVTGLTTTTQFRVQVQSGTCPNVFAAPATIYVYPIPAIQAVGSTTLSPGASVTLAVGRYYSYQWVKDNVDIPGATASSYVTNLPGSYTVRVTGKQGTVLAPYNSSALVVNSTTIVSSNLNYSITTNLAKAGLTSVNPYVLSGFQPNEVRQSINYMDGLGRTVQQIAIGQSPTGKDVIQPFAYDFAGRMAKQYLPYAYTTAAGNGSYDALAINGTYSGSNQYQFYQSAAKVACDTYPYAETIFEGSPLSRVTEQGAPGQAWQPGSTHTVRQVYNLVNSTYTDAALKNVKIFTPAGPTGAIYANNEIGVSVTTDENSNKTWTFVDKLGRTVLKRVQLDETVEGVVTPFLETYYAYDNRGNMALQIPPKASAKLSSGTTWSIAFSDEWCFTYTYDERNRLVEKKVPGTAAIFYAYDRFDRMVLMQDGNLRTLNKWLFTKYDFKGRPLMQGLYLNATHLTRAAIQTNVLDPLYPSSDPINYNGPAYFEDRGTSLHGYTNVAFPTINANATPLEVYSVNYFDTYDFDFNGTADYSYTAQGIAGEGTQVSAFGLPTGSKRLVLNTTTWVSSYQFYDKYNHVIQSRSNNHLSPAIDNLSTNVYNFDGTLNCSKTYHNGGGSNQVTIVNKYSYDRAGRVLKIRQQINTDPEVIVANYQYNELGQVVEKNLHCTYCPDSDPLEGQPGTSFSPSIVKTQYNNEQALVASNSIQLLPNFNVAGATGNFVARIGITSAQAQAYASANSLQSVDMRYNIRGWLTSINNAQLTNDGGVNNDDTNDYFGMELAYNTVDASLGNTAFYNGNISSTKWKGPYAGSGAADQRSYKFAYDKSDKLKTATFQKYGTAWNKETNAQNENITYDANGNILSLQRNRIQRTLSAFTSVVSAQPLDNLTYTYAATKGNQLTKVEDSGVTEGFTNGSTATTEYTYDTNGSMLTDANKNTAIQYNELGKPRLITITGSPTKTITYTYDGTGNKLKMVTSDGTTTTTTDYVGSFVYENANLSFFGSPEGRVAKIAGAYEYQYAIADHQGNTRVLFSSKAPAPVTYTATVEDNTITIEQTTFQNYPTGGNRSSLELFDHTDISGSVYTRSQLLNGGNNSQVGLAKTLKVYPGDVIHAEVYAKYWNVTSNTSNIAGFAAALTGAFGVTAVMTGEAGKAFSALNNYGGAVAGAGGSGSPSAPKAFITVLLFDNNFNFVDVAYDQIDVNAQQIGASPKAAFDLLVRDVTIKEPGYAYIYISNENPTQVDVFFDDLSITHTKTNVVQYSEYYPFGMQTANSWTRENTTGNNFLYNVGTESNASTGWYDLFFRNYDPTLGRFAQVDPLASLYHNQTTYQYGNNDPVYWSDPSGASSGDAYGDQLMRGNQTAALTFQNFVDAAFAARNDNSTMFGGSWNVLTYGSAGGPGGSMFARIGPGNSLNLQYWNAMRANLEAARKGDAAALQEYGYRNASSFTGHVDYISAASFWSVHLLNGNIVGSTSYAKTDFNWYVNHYSANGTSSQQQAQEAQSGGGADLTSQFNQRIGAMEATFGAVGNTMNALYGGPILSYPSKMAAFAYIQYKGANTEFMNPKQFPNSPFNNNGRGGYVNGEHFSPDDFGNYFYGVAARAMGILSINAIQGAGLFSIYVNSPTTDYTNFYGFFDERKDTRMILKGYYGK